MTTVLEGALEPDLRPLLSFQRGPGAVEEIAAKLSGWLAVGDQRRRAATTALAGEARARFGWEAVAEGVIATAQGRLDELVSPTA